MTMAISSAPEHDWTAAARIIMPVLLPVGAVGTDAGSVDRASIGLGHHGGAPLEWPGPVGLHVAVAIPADGFDVLVNVEHIVSWDVEVAAVLSTAMANLEAWSNSTPWEEEVDGGRRLLVSDSGERWDAGRILLVAVRVYLERELGGSARVIVAVPSRHLLVAGSLVPTDPGFMDDLRSFVATEAAEADEPVDGRLFELLEGGLTEVAG
jgi:hypothetical protein